MRFKKLAAMVMTLTMIVTPSWTINALPIDDGVVQTTQMNGRSIGVLNAGLSETLTACGYHGMKLDAKAISEKKKLAEIIPEYAKLDSGDDYMSNQVVFMASTREEAEQVADCYNGELTFYQYGVAAIALELNADKLMRHAEAYLAEEGSNLILNKSEIPVSVMDVVKLSADVDNDLPAVYPNMVYKVAEAEIGAFADMELNEENGAELMADVSFTTSDPYSKYQYAHEYIKDYEVWKSGITGKGVTIAVVDTGLQLDHEEFSGKIADFRYNVIADDSSQSKYRDRRDPSDDQGHGTHCSGIAAAAINNNKGGCGVAPSAMIMPIKVLDNNGGGYTNWTAAGILAAAENHADVISLSLGSYALDPLEEKAINRAIALGSIVVAASGNDSSSLKSYPAGNDAVISVGSLANAMDPGDNAYSENAKDNDGKGFQTGLSILETFTNDQPLVASSFTNYGSSVDVSVPGTDYLSSYCGSSNMYFIGSGTSQATPAVAGIVALMLEADPGLNQTQVQNILRKSTDKQIYCCPSDDYVKLKTGLLSAKAAVEAAKKVAPVAPEFYEYNTNSDGTVVSGTGKVLKIKGNGNVFYTDNGKDPAKYGVPYFLPIPLETSANKTYKAVSCINGVYGPVVTFACDARTTATSISSSSKLFVLPGKSVDVHVKVKPADAIVNPVYKTSNESVAYVDKNKICVQKTAKEGDSALITITDQYSGLSTSINVQVTLNPSKLSDLNLFGSNVTLASASGTSTPTKLAFKEKFKAAGLEPDWYAFQSSNPSVADFDDDYNLVAFNAGKTKVIINQNDGSGKKISINVNVVNPATGIKILSDTGFSTENGTVTAPLGNVKCKVKLTAVADSNGKAVTNKKVIWESSDPSVVNVSSSGIVTPAKNVSIGKTAVVTCKTTDGSNVTSSMRFQIVKPISRLIIRYQVDGGAPLTSGKKSVTVNVKDREYYYSLFNADFKSIKQYRAMPAFVDYDSFGTLQQGDDKTVGSSYNDFPLFTIKRSGNPNVALKYVYYRDSDINHRYEIPFRLAGNDRGSCTYNFLATDGSGKKLTMKYNVKVK